MFQSLYPTSEINPALKFAPWIEKTLKEQNDTDQTFCLEVNGFVKSTHKDPKPGNMNDGLKHSAFGANGAYWLTVDATLATISAFIHEGFLFRLGVKTEGTTRAHFSHADFVYLDCDEGSTVQESIDRYKHSAFLIYATPSFTPENQKHRIVLRLSQRCLDANTVEAILKFLVHQNPALDSSCTDPARVMYGSLEDEPFFYS